MFCYTFYNHKFISDIRLFNIPLADKPFSKPDVIIRKETFNSETYLKNGTYYYSNKDFFLLKIIGGFLRINSGKEILYDIDPNTEAESITPYIMGWGLAVVLSQMGYSVFHCSALVRNDHCFFVSGVSGAGKSTTSLELLKHNCKYLCDDMAFVEDYEDMLVYPSFPIQKICRDVSLNLEKENLYAIKNEREKYSFLNTSDYCDTPKPLTVFFDLIPSKLDYVKVEEITGIKKYYKVLENLFLEIPYAMSSFPDHVKFHCLKIAGNIRFYNIFRPIGKDTVEEITNCILKILDDKEL